MLAIEIIKHNVDPAEILNNELNEKLLATLQHFASILRIYNYNVNVYSENSLKKLNEISIEKKLQICSYYENWANWIAPEGEPLPLEDLEKSCLKKALDHYGLKASDEFWQTLEKDQIVEVYGEDMVQLYRSMNFFRITGYSLLDITVFEWYVLWNRPSKAIEETMNDLKEVVASYVPVKKFQIPTQLIRENYNTGLMVEPFTTRAIHAKFLNAGSLLAKDTNAHFAEPKGFICTSTAQVIALGEEASNIQFI